MCRPDKVTTTSHNRHSPLQSLSRHSPEKNVLNLVGVLVRNYEGELMGALSKPIHRLYSPLVTELIAIKEAIIFYVEGGFSGAEVVTDSKEAVRLILDINPYLGEGCFILEEIKGLLAQYNTFQCSYASRRINKAAHALVRHSLSLSLYEAWMEEGPSWLLPFLQEDVCNFVIA